LPSSGPNFNGRSCSRRTAMICSSVNDIDEEPRALGNSVTKRGCESTDPAGDHVMGQRNALRLSGRT
jgi:hypothetical protein